VIPTSFPLNTQRSGHRSSIQRGRLECCEIVCLADSLMDYTLARCESMKRNVSLSRNILASTDPSVLCPGLTPFDPLFFRVRGEKWTCLRRIRFWQTTRVFGGRLQQESKPKEDIIYAFEYGRILLKNQLVFSRWVFGNAQARCIS
jgi:hypothetical protein